MKNREVYVSVDVETDGPIPGINSMLSLGAAAYTLDDDEEMVLIDTFSVNLEQLPDGIENHSTMEWWASQKEAWAAHRENTKQPFIAMKEFNEWLTTLTNKASNLVCVAYPAGFDWTFLYWYMVVFTGKSPFSFSCIDMKTFAMVLLNKDYRKTTKRKMPKKWFSKRKHTHIALDDAIEQGELFMNMLKELRAR